MADRHIVDVHVLLIRDGELLLTQRRDSNPEFDGRWHLPSGKLDADESVLHAAVREAEANTNGLVAAPCERARVEFKESIEDECVTGPNISYE